MIDSTPIATAIGELQSPANSSASVSIDERIRICQECLRGLATVLEDWLQAAAVAKQCPNDTNVFAEELLGGPAVIARQLQLTIQTLKAVRDGANPRLPGAVRRLPSGQLSVPVFPTSGFFDSVTFSGLSSSVWMQSGVTAKDLHGQRVEHIRNGKMSGITAVLGAGNVSSIPATDCLNTIIFEGRRVVLKMNPVNEYLAPLFERAFVSLIKADLLRIVKGASEAGKELIQNSGVEAVHVTGSVATHDAIVWGANPEERLRRKQSNDPFLKKPVTSELGNVSPWIIVPGQYSKKQLHSQAQHLAASMTNNASFNCLTTRMVVTWDRWDQRQQFLDLISHYLSEIPRRPAYYPGAAERYRRFAGKNIDPDDQNRLPWTFLTGQSIDERPELFREESFTCVYAETALPGASPTEFLGRATDFVNDRLFGSLCASVTFPKSFRREHSADVDNCLQKLRYGTVCINQWSGLGYGLTSPPWGAYPGATLSNTESGIGNVHNTYLLDRIEKAVLQGPLINFPKPVWFSNHKNALNVAERLFALYQSPSILRLPSLFAAALTG